MTDDVEWKGLSTRKLITMVRRQEDAIAAVGEGILCATEERLADERQKLALMKATVAARIGQ